jgi:hypothetical protein
MVSPNDRCAGSANASTPDPALIRYYARAYECDEQGDFRVVNITHAEDEADSLALAEGLSRIHVGAVAFSLCSARQPFLAGLGRFGQTPD